MLPTSSKERAAALAAAARRRAGASTAHASPLRSRLGAALPSASVATFCAACMAWYLASALSSNTSKALLSAPRVRLADGSKLPPPFPYPVSLTLVQFVFVHLFCALACSPTAMTHVPGIRRPLGKLQAPTVHRVKEMSVLSFFNALGHALSSLAISRVPVSTVHTIKALTPLFTVLSFRILFSVAYPMRTYAALAPLTLGVMMACTGMAFSPDDLLGLSAALASTLVFVANNIFSKKVLSKSGSHGGDGEKSDKYSVLYYSSGISVVIMLPFALYTDVPRMLAARAPSLLEESLQRQADAMRSTAAGVLWGLLINGVVHFAQNVLAFSVLALVSPVTYSIAGLCKRIFVIVVAIIWFGQKISFLQCSGIVLTFVGLYMYNDAKTRSSNAAIDAKIRRDDRSSLPTTRADLLEGSITLPRQFHAVSSSQQLGHTYSSSSAVPLNGARGASSAWAAPGGGFDTHREGKSAFPRPAALPFDPRVSLPSPPPSGSNSEDGVDTRHRD